METVAMSMPTMQHPWPTLFAVIQLLSASEHAVRASKHLFAATESLTPSMSLFFAYRPSASEFRFQSSFLHFKCSGCSASALEEIIYQHIGAREARVLNLRASRRLMRCSEVNGFNITLVRLPCTRLVSGQR